MLVIKDNLVSLLQRYNEVINGSEIKIQTKKPTNHVIQGSNTTPLINASASSPSNIAKSSTTSNADILSELLGDSLKPTIPSSASPKTDSTTKSKQNNANSTFDELTEIFGSIENQKNDPTNYPTDLLNNLDLLEPISVFNTKSNNEKSEGDTNNDDDEMQQKQHGFKELREIDKLSEELFKKSLQTEQRQTTFKK